jgi:hypothetical protein
MKTLEANCATVLKIYSPIGFNAEVSDTAHAAAVLELQQR